MKPVGVGPAGTDFIHLDVLQTLALDSLTCFLKQSALLDAAALIVVNMCLTPSHKRVGDN